ncbi:hypothetical protein [Herminiimonas arsenitoxidans]|uniref:hypothetical protein n=1 Tax=Herminiimonas arsenitoxidans TaxID=1809410 RepID=UPI001E33737D|nr:hypothetical protein [Herminiimonas arsenitoxidans]
MHKLRYFIAVLRDSHKEFIGEVNIRVNVARTSQYKTTTGGWHQNTSRILTRDLYPDHPCAASVCDEVLPVLRQTWDSYLAVNNLHLEIIKWLEIVRRNKEDVFICVDYQTDWDLFCEALDYRVPPWCHYKLVSNEIVELMLYDFFKQSGLPEHHALYDAQVNRHAYRPRHPKK